MKFISCLHFLILIFTLPLNIPLASADVIKALKSVVSEGIKKQSTMVKALERGKPLFMLLTPGNHFLMASH